MPFAEKSSNSTHDATRRGPIGSELGFGLGKRPGRQDGFARDSGRPFDDFHALFRLETVPIYDSISRREILTCTRLKDDLRGRPSRQIEWNRKFRSPAHNISPSEVFKIDSILDVNKANRASSSPLI